MNQILASLLIPVAFVPLATGPNRNLAAACPTVMVTCATADCYTSPYSFKVIVGNGAPNLTLAYQWTVTTGRIVDGQGTSAIRVIADQPRNNLTATVEVKGFPAECSGMASISLILSDPPPPPVQEIAQF